MKPLKSSRLPCLTLFTVSCRTVPRPSDGSKITVPVSPKDSLPPCSVRSVPSGTGTVEDGLGDADDEDEDEAASDDELPASLAAPSELQPPSASAAAVVTAARGRTGRRKALSTGTFCTPDQARRGGPAEVA